MKTTHDLHICKKGSVIQPKHFKYLLIESDLRPSGIMRKLCESDNEDFIKKFARGYKRVFGLAHLESVRRVHKALTKI